MSLCIYCSIADPNHNKLGACPGGHQREILLTVLSSFAQLEVILITVDIYTARRESFVPGLMVPVKVTLIVLRRL